MRVPAAGLAAGLAVSILAGCSCPAAEDPCAVGADPVASLACPAPSATYGEEFWYAEAKADSDLWREALAFCSAEASADLVRCLEVRRTRLFLALERESAEGRARREAGEPVLPDPTDDSGGVSPLPFSPAPPPAARDFEGAAPGEAPSEKPEGSPR